jgi:thiamine biosynthesis protein ThiS
MQQSIVDESWLVDNMFLSHLGLFMDEAVVTIQVNGEPHRISGSVTVSELLRELNISPDRVAVELNLEIVERGAFDTHALKDGDRIEILSFIGGGAA